MVGGVTRDERPACEIWLCFAYVVLGVLVASQHDFYSHVTTVSQMFSAVVAATLWPLVLLGASLHLNFAQL